MSIRHTHPIRIWEDELAKAYEEPDYAGELPTPRVPIGIESFDLFRLCRTFGCKLERARKQAA